MSHNDTDEQFDDIYDKAKQPIKKTAKNMAKNLGKKMAKAMAKTIKYIIGLIIGFFGWFIVPVLIIAFIGYFVTFEWKGSEKEYSFKYENETELAEDGTAITKVENMKDENKIIRDFYSFFAGQSYYQIIGNKKELIKPDDDKAVRDYYQREDLYKLTPNFLFSLDEDVYDGDWKYPEQFVKPVHYDEETLELKDLVNDESKTLQAVSKEIDMETGKTNGKEVYSVKDYGLASVLAYNQTDDWKITDTLKGSYNKKDVWDSASGSVKTIAIEPEPFEIKINVEKINLIEKIINFKGTKRIIYEYQEKLSRGLASGTSSNSSDEVESILYGTHTETVYATDESGNGVLDEMGNPIVISSTKHNLYKHRSSDSGVFIEEPIMIQEDDNSKDLGKNRDYLVDYLSFFEADIPEEMTQDFKFDGRIDYDSYVFDESGMLKDSATFELGSQANSPKAQNTLQHLPIMKKYADEFGTDPYIMLAMITIESGGDPRINKDGIAQITGSNRSVTAKNKQGIPTTVRITGSEKYDIDKSIRFATAYHKSFLEKYDGDPYKAIQAYNLGPGTMEEIRKKNPQAWNNGLEWLKYREAGRIEIKPNSRSANYSFFPFPEGVRTKSQYPMIWGNSNYLEMVLQYYPKDGQTGISYTSNNSTGSSKSSAISGMFMKFVKLFSKEEDVIHTRYKKTIREDTISDILTTTSSLDNDLLFSDVDLMYNAVSFWEEGFKDELGASFGSGDISATGLKAIVDKYIGIPYVWGGKSMSGLDCSGFTTMVFKDLGINIGDGTQSQKDKGQRVNYKSVDDLMPGDLIFYGAGGKVSHVAIYMGDGIRAHAPQTGDVVKYDDKVTGYSTKPIINVQRHTLGIGGAGPGQQFAPNTDGFASPLASGSYRISSHYGMRMSPTYHKMMLHAGIDLAAPSGTPIYASKEGTVTYAKESNTLGRAVDIQHEGGVKTRYFHMTQYFVKEGQYVKTGQHIGNVGTTGKSTGPHLHFEYRVNNKSYNPINIINGQNIK